MKDRMMPTLDARWDAVRMVWIVKLPDGSIRRYKTQRGATSRLKHEVPGTAIRFVTA
jgi:hypothetical protein